MSQSSKPAGAFSDGACEWHAWRRPDVSLARVHVFGLVLCGRDDAAARLVSRVGTGMTYVLPSSAIDVAAAFQALELQKRGGGEGLPPLISEFGLSQSTLEDVFVNVIEREGAVNLNA